MTGFPVKEMTKQVPRSLVGRTFDDVFAINIRGEVVKAMVAWQPVFGGDRKSVV